MIDSFLKLPTFYYKKKKHSSSNINTISENDKKRFKKNSILFTTTSALLGISLSAAGTFLAPLVFLTGGYAIIAAIEAWKSVDPPQLNYKRSLKRKWAFESYSKNPFDRLITNVFSIASYSEAYLDSVEKLQGAKLSKDKVFVKKLAKQCNQYNQFYESELEKHSGLLNNVLKTIQNSEYDFAITPNQFLKTRKNLVKNGIPDQYHQTLFDAGFDRMLIDLVYRKMTANRSKPKNAFRVSDILTKMMKIQTGKITYF